MITEINESETLTKSISYSCKCKCDSRKYNSNQKWNNDKCRCEYKNPKKHRVCKKYYIWNSTTCSCKNGKYVASIIDDLAIMCDEIIVETKTVPTNFNEKNPTCKKINFSLLEFLQYKKNI